LQISKCAIILGVAVVFGIPGITAAQTADKTAKPARQEKRVTKEEPLPLATSKSHVGDFNVVPYFDIGQLYDDNIFALPFAEIDDFVTIINPSITAKSDWDQHKLNMDAWASIGRYRDFDSEDYEDYGASGEFRYDLADKSNIFGSLGYKKAHEDRGSVDASLGLTPTFYSQLDIALGMSHDFGGAWTRFGITRDVFDFDNVPSLRGSINNDDRDRNMDAAGIRFGYPVGKTVDLFVQGAYDRREYDESVDDNGYMRDSDGTRLAAGLIIKPRKGVNLELLAGTLRQNYEDKRFSNISKPDYGLDLSWRPSRASRLSLLLDRTLGETTLPGSSGYLLDLVSLSMDRHLQHNLFVSAHGSYSEYDYQDIDREEDVIAAGFGIKYFIRRPLFLAFDYTYLRRDSSNDLADYYRNKAFISLGLDGLDTGKAALLAPLPGQGEQSYGGFYAGLQAGHAGIAADYGGFRGPGQDGTYLETGLVANAPAWRVFGGYGYAFGRFYLGAELEAENAESELKFTREVNRRRLRVAREDAYGLSARLGYLNDDRSLVYARLGAMRSEFQSDYTFQDVSISQNNKLDAFQAGLGTEVPLTKHAAWRMDYTWRDYPRFEIDYELAADNLHIDESVFHVGLQANFSAAEPDENSSGNEQSDRFTGWYIGGQLGHGVMFTDFEGRRGPPAQGGYVSTVLGSDGFSAGGIAGFGALFNQFYFGFEGELEAGLNQWEFDRQENVRTFTVDKRETGGAIMHLGYALRDRALIYAGAGLVTTRFETRYDFRDALEIVDKRVHGTRLVLGTEVPTTENFSWRFEYSYTDYKPYSTVEETNDVFDINETLFRAGAIVRF
jgi:opacity protein-like surface antigen